MKFFLICSIRCYWLLIPPRRRNRCLFKKSCSNYVFDITKEDGLIEGLRAFHYRFKHCRSGYYIINGEAGEFLISARNEVFDTNEINEKVLKNE